MNAKALVDELFENFGVSATDANPIEKDERLMTSEEKRAKQRREWLAKLKKRSMFPNRRLVGVKESDFISILKNLKQEASTLSDTALKTTLNETALRFSRVANHLELAINEIIQLKQK